MLAKQAYASLRVGLDQPPDAAQERGHGVLVPRNIIPAGAELNHWHKRHLEAIYCAAGNGTITEKVTGEAHEVSDGTLYALDKHDQHTLRGGTEDMRLICTFNSPVTGREVHDEDGAYLPDTSED